MAKKKELSIGELNQMVETFHEESDRGAAILAGSFAEHALAQYLKFRIRDKKLADKLFDGMGPLSSFSQCISIAFAFDLITAAQYKDLEKIRKIRNHFAHHPLDTTFKTDEVKKLCVELSMFNQTNPKESSESDDHLRVTYLLSCGFTSGSLLDEIESAEAKAA